MPQHSTVFRDPVQMMQSGRDASPPCPPVVHAGDTIVQMQGSMAEWQAFMTRHCR